ncbi:MAG TPA: hypothetical protein PK445_10755, partial [Methanolinea sp.]|nr:hypothetical protein [Methanolinea sp.]
LPSFPLQEEGRIRKDSLRVSKPGLDFHLSIGKFTTSSSGHNYIKMKILISIVKGKDRTHYG